METNPGFGAINADKGDSGSLGRGQDSPLSTASLFAKGGNEIVIEHQGEQYRLRQTRNGKLILTK